MTPEAGTDWETYAAEAEQAFAAADLAAIEDARVRYLGRKSPLVQALRGVRDRETGMLLNGIRQRLEGTVDARERTLEADELDRRLREERIDVTLPGEELPLGHLHPITQVRRAVEDAFLGLGWEVRDDREVETVEYNFDKLAFLPTHSARSPRDTFFFDENHVLRTETSPSQIHVLEEKPPPVYMVSIGRVYRRDAITATRYPIFHQFEGLAVDRGLTLADLKGTLLHVMRALYGPERRVRFRTHFFPFTEPSIEPDVSCGICDGAGCRTCKFSGWIEMGGAGMVDPAVFENVGLDPAEWTGFAFGCGLERTTQLRHDIPDIRALWEGDLRVLRQILMRVPVSWLRDYVPIEMPLRELATRLSIATAEVEGIDDRGVPDTDGNLGLFKIGRVLEAEKHPNADRLQITKVDVGEGEPRSIVCGAWNFGVGATVGVALPGALLPPRPELPDGLRLERRKVRGEVSDGMILAEDEIGLGGDHAGIMLLPEVEPGTPLGDVLPLAEHVLLVEATGNRPDLYSVYGLAREIATLYDLPLADMSPNSRTTQDSPRTAPERQVEVDIQDFYGCPRYVAHLFEDVQIAASPQWLRTRLYLAGQRPLTNVVDVTNYVMFALGNPIHAFDFTTLHESRIVVRRAQPGEKLTTLDSVERELVPDDLVIADADRAVALAGIMGGEETEIGEATTTVLLEAANFEPYGIYRTSERQRLRTEGSNRWEKGVDPYLAGPAAELATSLILELTGASWTAAADVKGELPERPVISFRPEAADRLIGVETPPDAQYAILERLGFERRDGAVVAPTWRARDMTREVDVIEEIARFRLEDVPFTLPARREMTGLLTRDQRLRRRVEDVLAGLGFSETYTPSLRPDDDTTWKLPEPISVDFTALRTSLLPSLVEAARRNVDAGARAIALFEIARVYLPGGDLPEERVRVAGIAQGGFLHVKGAVETLYAALKAEPSFERGQSPLLHPGKTARTPAGVLGEVHPRELDGEWGAFELDLADLFAISVEPVIYRDFITFPAVRQDIAVAVPEDVAAGELVAAAREAAGEELREIRVFDVYRGEQVGPGRKSVAFSVAYQAPDRTLTEDDAQRLREAIVSALADRFGAEWRAG